MWTFFTFGTEYRLTGIVQSFRRLSAPERIAACWADSRTVPQVVVKPDWTKHRNAAPFKRNDQMLEALPIGVVVFPGSGISANLADKARKMGIPLWRFTEAAPPKAGDGAV